MLWSLTSLVRWPCTALLFLKLLNDALSFASPLLLGGLVTCMTGSPDHCTPAGATHADSSCAGGSALCWAYAGALFAVAVAKAFLGTQYTYRIKRLGAAVYSIAASAPLQALLHTPAWAMGEFGEGALLHTPAVPILLGQRALQGVQRQQRQLQRVTYACLLLSSAIDSCCMVHAM